MMRSEPSGAWEHPSSLGPYRLLEVLGQGGMGVVYAGVHRQTGQAAAVKTVRVRHESQLASIRREIVALSRLDHPGVVRVLGTGLDEAVPWYAMERLEGSTLATLHEQGFFASIRAGRPTAARAAAAEVPTEGMPWLQGPETREPLGWTAGLAGSAGPVGPVGPAGLAGPAAGGRLTEALTLVGRLCRTLAFLHGEGVIHRDLKPSNLFVRPGLRPVLVDFGLVRREGREGREVLDVGLVEAGTAGYMAPEQFRGEPGDARADLYAVGCLLYELLTGRLPFVGSTVLELRSAHLALSPVRPSELVTGVAPALEALVMKLLEKQPRQRVGHAADIEEALSALGAEPDTTLAAPAARPYVYRAALAGRERVLGQLDAHLERARQGDGGIVLLGGESGVGKTHLATVFARQAQRRGFQVVVGSCLPAFGPDGHEAAPLHPFRRLLLTVADRCLELGPMATAGRVGLAALLLAPYEPALAGLPGVDALPPPPELAARAARTRLIGAMIDVIAFFLESAPLLLVLDDVQWLDELSAQVLRALEPDIFRTRLLVVCAHRNESSPDELTTLRGHPLARELPLDPLDEVSVQALVADVLAVERPPEGLVQFLVQRCRGNPFFVTEYLRAAVFEGQFVRHDGRWQVQDGAVDLPLPDTLGALVQRRLAGLGAGARALVEAAAVLGHALTWARLERLAGLPPDESAVALRELRRAQVLDEGDGDSLRFAHDRLRQVAHEALTPARGADLHRRAARLLEDQPDVAPRQLAAHFAAGHEPLEAIHHLEQAGRLALRTFSNRDALECLQQAQTLDASAAAQRPASWEQALAAAFLEREGLASTRTPGRPPPPSPGRRAAALRRARWWRGQADAHFALGDLDACADACRAALALLGFAPPNSPAGWAVDLLRQSVTQAGREQPGWVGRLSARLGAPAVHPADPQTSGTLERALFAEAALLMQRLSERFYFHLNAVPMLATSLAAVNLAGHAPDVQVAMPYGMLGITLTLSKLRGAGRRYLDRGVEVAHRTGDLPGLAFCLLTEAALCAGDARWSEARAHSEAGLAIVEPRGDHHSVAYFQTMLGHVDFYTGRFDASRARFLAIAGRARSLGHQQHLAWGLYATARALLPLGQTDEAHSLLVEARRLLDPLADDPSKIICTGLLALALTRLDRLEEAAAVVADADARIARNLPTVFSTVDGYASVAEVHLERWRRSGLDARRPDARRAVGSLLLLSVNLPLGWPHHHRLLGRSLWQSGHHRLARDSWDRSARRARSLAMPYLEALARRDLALASPAGSVERQRHLDEACRLLDPLDCPLDLDAPLDR